MRRIAALVSVAAVTLVASGTAGAKNGYPKKAEKKFVSTCVAAAKKKGGSDVKTKKARQVCKYTLTCIEGKLSYKEYQDAKATDPAVKSCIAKTKKHFS